MNMIYRNSKSLRLFVANQPKKAVLADQIAQHV